MNQDQRKFLIEQVSTTCREQIDELKDKIPHKPSLNNYLVAAFLDDTIRFNNIKVLKEKIKTEVLKFGADDVLITVEDRWYSRKKKEDDIVNVRAEDLFIIPASYTKALVEYEKIKADIDEQIKVLRGTEKTITMKLQIGSSATMDRLVMQIDNMGDLDLVNNTLLLGEGK